MKHRRCMSTASTAKRSKNKLKVLWKKLSNITPEIKNKLIDLYLELCYERHRLSYLSWREYKLELSNKEFKMGELLNDK